MLIAEEFLLLAVDDASGRKTMDNSTLEPALGAALVVELALAERIGVTAPDAGFRERGRVRVLHPAPTDDAELDGLLAVLQQRDGDKLKDLISPMSGRRISKGLVDRLLARLVARRVLELREEKVLGLFPTRSFPTRDPRPEEEIRRRLQAALVGGETPIERTSALVALLQATNRVTRTVVAPDKRALKARAKQLSEGDWAGKAVKQAIDEMYATLAAVSAGAAGGGGDGGGGGS